MEVVKKFNFNIDEGTITVNNNLVPIIGDYDNPLFAGKELCEALGYQNSQKALFKHVKTKHKTTLSEYKKLQPAVGCNFLSIKQKPSYHEGKAVYITEHGAYHLAMKCQLSIGDEFRDWLAEDVIPTLRKTGQYKILKEKEDKLNESMSLLAIKNTELENEKEKGVLTRSMLKKVEDEKQKIEEEKDKALRKMLRLKEITITQKERTITQIIYISTSKSYAAQHRFKVGGVEGRRRLKGRLSDYNGRSASGDEWYFCNLIDVADFRKAEGRIEDIIGKFRDKKDKEIYIIPYRKLLKIVELICKNYTAEVSTLNSMLKDIVDEFEDADLLPTIPEEIPQSTFKITRVEFGKNVGTTIIQGKATKTQLIQEFEKYIQSLPNDETEINRKELFDDLSRFYTFNKNDAWVWLKEFMENKGEGDKTFILKYR